MHRFACLRSLLVTILTLACLCGCGIGHRAPSAPAASAGHHLVVLGDPHLPGKNLAAKEAALERINSWDDVELVIAVGDITDLYGTDEEYAAARTYFNRLRKPFAPIAGNHDYIYQTPLPTSGGFNTASRAEQEAKLDTFRRSFNLGSLSYGRSIGGYQFLFLSTDHESFSTGLSEPQLSWLRAQLFLYRHLPTIIVFHAPLFGTQDAFRRYINRPHSVAQPAATIHAILAANPQVFLWVSGHTHTPVTEPSFASLINIYANQVTNIHNKDMKGETIYTNSLRLFPDRVEIRTFNHNTGAWVPELDRTVMLPAHLRPES